MITKKLQKNKAFVILFAVMISGILLAVTFGVSNITYNELRFSTSAKDTNDAFFAADVGAECALINDKSTSSVFISSSTTTTCNNSTISVTPTSASSWSFVVPPSGGGSQSCAIVTVNKTDLNNFIVVSKGYNVGDATCSSSNPNRVERELRVSYGGSSISLSTNSYRYVRLVITGKRGTLPNPDHCIGGTDDCVQFAELVLLQNGTVVPWPSGSSVTNPGGTNPNSAPYFETPDKIIDGNTATKWLDRNYNIGVVNGSVQAGSTLLIDTITGITFNGYRWATANDAPYRDPASWTLSGSNDGLSWTTLDSESDPTNIPLGRNINASDNIYTPDYTF